MDAPSDVVRAALTSISLFSGVPEDALTALASLASSRAIADSATIELQSAGFIMLTRGRLEVLIPATGETWSLHAGDTFGEYDWLADNAAVGTAYEGVELLTVHRSELTSLLKTYPVMRISLAQAAKRRVEYLGVRTAFRRSAMFALIDKNLGKEIENELAPVRLFGGEQLFKEGDPGDSLYLVVNGRLRVMGKDPEANEIVVAEIGPGETVGEMALMTGKPRAASVWAVRDTHLGHLSGDAYRRLLIKYPEQMMRLFGGRVAERLARANRGEGRQSTGIHTLAIVPAGPTSPVGKFSEALVRSLAVLGPSILVSSETIGRQFGDPLVAQTADWDGSAFGFTEWMSRLEQEYRYVVYQADPGLTPWTERCIRQGDEVVVVGDAAGDPAPGEIETDLLDHLPEIASKKASLVLMHPAGTIQPGTSRWLSKRKMSRHYHVRDGQAADFHRLTRFLTGQAIGIALGGGFARGLAHIGVFQALESLGIPIDAIGGASMGAVVGGLRAQGWSHDRCIREIREGCKDSLNDMTLPFVAFKRGGKYSDLIVGLFGETQIEDLPLPFFCVSANLNRAEVAAHKHGGLAKAILASSRAPAIFPPIIYNGELHVDGGLINNVPVDLMKPFTNHGIVFGVDVSPPHELFGCEDYGYSVSGWDAARSRFGILGKKKNFYPSILLVLMRTIEFGGIAFKSTRTRFANVYMQPPLLGFKRTDWHLAEKIVDVSREDALEKLGKWLETPAADGVRHWVTKLPSPA